MRPSGSQMLVALGATWIVVRTALAGYACLSNPCVNGVCLDDVNSTYSCYCIDGYTGIHCQTNWDECWSSPCKNGGLCIDGIAAFNCSCPDGFVGDVCEVNYDECESNPCHNNGTCVDADNGYTCSCVPGYSGIHCELDIAVCNATNETRCANGGLCEDGPGITFTCLCTPGWEGTLCEDPIDECASNPCQNGGICLDLHADYACACPFGFTGKNCEEEIIMCDDNPCENDAICLMEDSISVCYCVPDFHGDRCQFQYDECQLGVRCKNGGSCIDGIDNFTCSCPPDLTGLLCECLILNETDYDCNYIRPTPYETSTLESSTSEGREETPAISSTSSYFSTTESSTSSEFTKFPITVSSETSVPNTTLEYDLSSTRFTQTSTVTSSITYSSFSPFTSTSSEGESSSTTALFETTTKFPYSEITPFSSSLTTTTEELSTTTAETSSANVSEFTRGTTSGISEITTPTSVSISSEVTTESSSTFSTEINLTIVPTTGSTSMEITSSTETSESTTSSIISTKPPEITFSTITSSTSSDFTAVTPVNVTSSVTELSSTMSSFFTEEPSIFSQTPTSTTSFEFLTSTEFENITVLPVPDCSKTFCLNGGTCILTIEGHKCVCPFDAEGLLCEIKLGIKRAAFNGHSFLSHKLPKSSKLTIETMAKTLSSSGILFYANMENTYMILFIQSGQLKFQFSCGFQTMLLSELKVPVNTGYDMSIQAKLEFTKDLKYCNASLKVNNTLSMSGNQVAFVEHFSKTNSWLHLGAVPHEYVRDYVLTIPGFTGCMDHLKVNDEKRHIFKDAQDGLNIKECSSLACLADPCQNGATCVEHNDTWSCNCRNGYIGDMCQQSICDNNPCQFGATCVPYTGSGYLCLCPFGKHGHFCENDLEIMSPSFSSSVQGLSSFSAYPVPNAITNNMELSFKFIPQTMEQISLLLFLGQHGVHDSSADHLAVSFVRGYILVTWNLGSGPRRIFTNKPIENYDNLPHTVRLGRFGRRVWLKVDNHANITGRSPGKLVQLDVVPILYLGGHTTANFSSLPHDLPLHSGFSGCIFDAEMRTGALILPLQGSRFAFGRSLGQCSMIECHERSCQNGGVCLQHGPTFTCLCQDSWFGPFCSLKRNPCDSTSHNCSQGSTCVPLVAGYECDCPIGKSGQYCEKDETLSDVSLSGKRSFILLSPVEFDSYKFIIEFELRPLSDKGLILFIGKIDSTSFLSLSMQGSGLEVRVSLGQHKISDAHLLVVRSNKLLAIGVWQPIRIGVSGRKVMLSVDGIVNSGILDAGEVLPIAGSSFYIGGMPDLSHLPTSAVSTVPIPYNGCIRKFFINQDHIPLTTDRVLQARNVADCDGTPCGGDVCKNGGTCWLDPNLNARCSCPERFSGERCEILTPCSDHGCENHGRCEEKECSCTVGYGGAYCETEIHVETPMFFGNSYLMVESKKDKKRNVKMVKDVRFIHLNVSTATANGMILWSVKGEEFLGIGIERGYLKFVWTFPGSDTFVVEVPAVGHVSDGIWHEIEMSLDPDNVTLWVDKTLVHRQADHHLKDDTFALNDRIFFVGGFPQNMSVVQETFGFFKSNFVGCIKSLSSEQNNTVDLLSYNGENIGTLVQAQQIQIQNLSSVLPSSIY